MEHGRRMILNLCVRWSSGASLASGQGFAVCGLLRFWHWDCTLSQWRALLSVIKGEESGEKWDAPVLLFIRPYLGAQGLFLLPLCGCHLASGRCTLVPFRETQFLEAGLHRTDGGLRKITLWALPPHLHIKKFSVVKINSNWREKEGGWRGGKGRWGTGGGGGGSCHYEMGRTGLLKGAVSCSEARRVGMWFGQWPGCQLFSIAIIWMLKVNGEVQSCHQGNPCALWVAEPKTF